MKLTSEGLSRWLVVILLGFIGFQLFKINENLTVPEISNMLDSKSAILDLSGEVSGITRSLDGLRDAIQSK